MCGYEDKRIRGISTNCDALVQYLRGCIKPGPVIYTNVRVTLLGLMPYPRTIALSDDMVPAQGFVSLR